MKNLCVILCVLLLPLCLSAQNEVLPISAEQREKDASGRQNNMSGGKIVLPPEKTKPVKIVKFAAPPTIDGRLDDEAWKSAPLLKDFYQTSPGDNVAPSKPTEVMLGYDEKNLYLAFRCFDDQGKVRATVARRDAVLNEDNVRVWLDTYNDQRRAYVLAFNPLGIQQDGIFTEGRGADYSVDIVMESKGVIEDWGWSVEVKIPFKSLRYVAGRGKLWGFNAARNIDRFNDELDQWLPDNRNISGFLIKHGKISGLDEIKTERTLEITPSVTVSESGRRRRTVPLSVINSLGFDPVFYPVGIVDPGRFTNESVKPDLGVTLKYTITPNVTLDAAVNPDFAEIEADAPVVTANQRFPIFFEEKRPFFLEGIDIFQSPLQPFYSRTIIDPDIAAKLTGKIGKTSFGFLAASDNAPGNYSEDERRDPLIRPRISEFLDKDAYFGVLRLKRDIGRENNVGFFGTARVFPKNRNFVSGFDGKFKLNPRLVMQFQLLGTHSRKVFYDPDADRSSYRTGNGVGYFWNLDYTTKNRGWYLEASGRSNKYRTDAGFTPRVNTNRISAAGRLSTEPKPDAKLIRLDWRPSARLVYDWQGRSQGGSIGNSLDFTLRGNLSIYPEAGIYYERIFEEEFGARRSIANPQGAFFGAAERSAYKPYANIGADKTISKRLSVYGSVGMTWNNLDYDFGNGNRFPRASAAFADYLNSPDYIRYIRLLTLDPNNPDLNFPNPPALDPGKGRQFDLELGGEYKPIDPLRVSLEYQKSKLTRYDTKLAAFDSNILTVRSTYQFTRFTFTRLRVDYSSLDSNFSGQALVGWNPSPGTALYVGYNDNFNYNSFSPFTGQFEPYFQRNSRTFFIRASYLFRKSL